MRLRERQTDAETERERQTDGVSEQETENKNLPSYCAMRAFNFKK